MPASREHRQAQVRRLYQAEPKSKLGGPCCRKLSRFTTTQLRTAHIVGPRHSTANRRAVSATLDVAQPCSERARAPDAACRRRRSGARYAALSERHLSCESMEPSHPQPRATPFLCDNQTPGVRRPCRRYSRTRTPHKPAAPSTNRWRATAFPIAREAKASWHRRHADITLRHPVFRAHAVAAIHVAVSTTAGLVSAERYASVAGLLHAIWTCADAIAQHFVAGTRANTGTAVAAATAACRICTQVFRRA